MEIIIVSAVIIGGIGLVIGILLGLAGKKFAVETDERETAVREALPGNNCGGCGYPGCDGLAAAMSKAALRWTDVPWEALPWQPQSERSWARKWKLLNAKWLLCGAEEAAPWPRKSMNITEWKTAP